MINSSGDFQKIIARHNDFSNISPNKEKRDTKISLLQKHKVGLIALAVVSAVALLAVTIVTGGIAFGAISGVIVLTSIFTASGLGYAGVGVAALFSALIAGTMSAAMFAKAKGQEQADHKKIEKLLELKQSYLDLPGREVGGLDRKKNILNEMTSKKYFDSKDINNLRLNINSMEYTEEHLNVLFNDLVDNMPTIDELDEPVIHNQEEGPRRDRVIAKHRDYSTIEIDSEKRTASKKSLQIRRNIIIATAVIVGISLLAITVVTGGVALGLLTGAIVLSGGIAATVAAVASGISMFAFSGFAITQVMSAINIHKLRTKIAMHENFSQLLRYMNSYQELIEEQMRTIDTIEELEGSEDVQSNDGITRSMNRLEKELEELNDRKAAAMKEIIALFHSVDDANKAINLKSLRLKELLDAQKNLHSMKIPDASSVEYIRKITDQTIVITKLHKDQLDVEDMMDTLYEDLQEYIPKNVDGSIPRIGACISSKLERKSLGFGFTSLDEDDEDGYGADTIYSNGNHQQTAVFAN